MQIGMIGLGRMGAGMVTRLLRDNRDCVVHVCVVHVCFVHVEKPAHGSPPRG